MLKFLLGKRGAVKAETQRQTFERLVKDLNEVIEGLDEKPMITIDPNTGAFELKAPERFPDEALALPAPEETEDTAKAKDVVENADTSEGDDKAAA